MRVFVLLTLVTLGAAEARAETSGACAARLSLEARTIFDAAAPGFSTAPDRRAFMTETVKGLAMSGKVQRSTARDSALAAGECLKLPR